jgi:hypothetical protein
MAPHLIEPTDESDLFTLGRALVGVQPFLRTGFVGPRTTDATVSTIPR